MRKAILGCVLMVGLSGCIVQPPSPTGFYWGNYSKYLYEYKKNPNPQTLALYKASLERIIRESNVNQSRKVPPGVYAELGNIYLQEGNKDEALKWFQQEQTQFPESTQFMKSLMEKASS